MWRVAGRYQREPTPCRLPGDGGEGGPTPRRPSLQLSKSETVWACGYDGWDGETCATGAPWSTGSPDGTLMVHATRSDPHRVGSGPEAWRFGSLGVEEPRRRTGRGSRRGGRRASASRQTTSGP